MTNAQASTKDALVALAKYAGVTLPERDKSADRRSLYRVMRRAAALFNDALTSSEPEIGDATGADEAFTWLTEARRASDDDIDFAEIGFVPDFPRLRLSLEELLGPSSLLIECGLLVKSSGGRLYCPFAGRVTFPIRDDRGRVVGFGARSVPEVTRHQEPKFVNSRQTAIYDKSNVLYGMEHISDDTQRVIVCEGYLDAIAVNMLGDETLVGVAACGTSVTHAHVELLLDLVDDDAEIVFVMDGDDAGQKAMARLVDEAWLLDGRGFGILLEESAGKDPWECHVAGTLKESIASRLQRPILDSCVRASLMSIEGGPEQFDANIAANLSNSPSAEFSDELLRAASSVRGMSVGDYGEKVRRVELSSRQRRGSGSAPHAEISSAVHHLVSRLMQIRPIELRGVASTVGIWDEIAQGFVERWLPVDGQADVAALGYVLFPHGNVYDSEVVQAVSSCISLSEEVESIEPVLRGLARAVLSQAGRLVREAPAPVLDRVRAARSLTSADIRIDDEVENLVLLLDVARELDAVEA